MKENKIMGENHFLHDCHAWVRELDFYLQENAFLKTRLSQVLDEMLSKDFIDKAEYFQGSIIQSEESIKELKTDISRFQLILKESIAGKTTDNGQLPVKYNKLNIEMGFFEKNFHKLKVEFNQCLVSFL